jgi:hypothetical protein
MKSVAMEQKHNQIVQVKNTFSKRRQNVFAEDSWGYKDSFFEYDKSKNFLFLRGKSSVHRKFSI